jgi:hypothetical protein
MVFSLEHDIKVTKNHQNLLPTQSVLVAHTVEFYAAAIILLINANGGRRFGVRNISFKVPGIVQFLPICDDVII